MASWQVSGVIAGSSFIPPRVGGAGGGLERRSMDGAPGFCRGWTQAQKKGRPGLPDALNGRVESSLMSHMVESPEESAGKQGRRRERENPGRRNIANGGDLKAALVGGHGSGHARTEDVCGTDG